MANNKYKRLRAFINFIYEIEPDVPERLLSEMHFVKKPVKTFTISDAYFDRVKKFYNECVRKIKLCIGSYRFVKFCLKQERGFFLSEKLYDKKS